MILYFSRLLIVLLIPVSLQADPYVHAWDFGDGSTSTEKNPKHRYEKAGIYQVTHTIYQASNLIDSKQRTVNLVLPAIKSQTIRTHVDTDPGYKVTLSAVIDSTEPLGLDFYWLLSDGTILEGQTVSHTMPSSGEYTAQLQSQWQGVDLLTTDSTFTIDVPDTLPVDGGEAAGRIDLLIIFTLLLMLLRSRRIIRT